MGMFDFLKRNPNKAPGWLERLFPRNSFTHSNNQPFKSNRQQIEEETRLRRFKSQAVQQNSPNKDFNRLNLASKEARMKEMQKRRASLQSKPKAPFGRR